MKMNDIGLGTSNWNVIDSEGRWSVTVASYAARQKVLLLSSVMLSEPASLDVNSLCCIVFPDALLSRERQLRSSKIIHDAFMYRCFKLRFNHLRVSVLALCSVIDLIVDLSSPFEPECCFIQILHTHTRSHTRTDHTQTHTQTHTHKHTHIKTHTHTHT